jgi:DNA-binding NarL/FixJ family response regulator
MKHSHLIAMNLVAFLDDHSLRSQKQLLAEGTLFSAYLKIPIFFDERLTPCEIDCLTLMALGYSPIAVGEYLKISLSKVEYYFSRLQNKMGCSDMSQAIIKGMKYGEVQLCFPTK